jgi:hypothetical protein
MDTENYGIFKTSVGQTGSSENIKPDKEKTASSQNVTIKRSFFCSF